MQTHRKAPLALVSSTVVHEAATLRRLDTIAALDARRCARTLRLAGYPAEAAIARELAALYLRRARATRLARRQAAAPAHCFDGFADVPPLSCQRRRARSLDGGAQ